MDALFDDLIPQEIQDLFSWFEKTRKAINADSETVVTSSVHTLQKMRADSSVLYSALLLEYAPLSLYERGRMESLGKIDALGLMDKVLAVEDKYSFIIGQKNSQANKINEEKLRKMILTMTDDVRSLLLILVRRLSVLRHTSDFSKAEQQEIGKETLKVHTSLANRLGLWELKWELEDLSFRYLDAENYYALAQKVEIRRSERERYVHEFMQDMSKLIAKKGINFEISGRTKHLYGIWKKMSKKNLSFEQLYDIYAVRILTDEVSKCYEILSVLHEAWEPNTNEFSDYIATPKGNGYQSIHSIVTGPSNRYIEVQIRTYQMHKKNESGSAAHWRYKENIGSDDSVEQKISYLRELLDWSRDVLSDDSEAKTPDITKAVDSRVYAFTPQGKVIDLPIGSTPIDFAYTIHTNIGHRARRAVVNGKLVKLNYVLNTGDVVELQTSKSGGPARDWLRTEKQYVFSSRSKNKIKAWFRNQDKTQHIESGKKILDLERMHLNLKDLSYEKIANQNNYKSTDEMLLAIGRNIIKPLRLLSPFLDLGTPVSSEPSKIDFEKKNSAIDIDITGVSNFETRLAKCCQPTPSDLLRGYITSGKGITVHRANCSNILNTKLSYQQRMVDVKWGAEPRTSYSVDLKVISESSCESKKLHNVVSHSLSHLQININIKNSHQSGSKTEILFSAIIPSTIKIGSVLKILNDIPEVNSAFKFTH